ncbi:MAG: T9SS type A sorting domain-containing protein, partial [Bacteroidales bacterium]|nr:T9SS type A sorting domain-containing protein [Bacteroidales bacterium]
AFITLRGSARLDGVSIWYPEQSASSIVPYPPTILNERNSDGRYPKHLSQVNCVNLINSYFGINIGTINTALPVIGHIYGSPLKVGIRIDGCSDVSRLMDIHFTPKYWAWSGMPNSPAENGAHAAFMLAEGIGIDYLRSDNGFNGFWEIAGYNKGMVMSQHYSGGPFYNIDIQKCVDGLTLKELNQVPACFSNSIFEGSDAALVLDYLTGSAQFFNSDFRSESATVKDGENGANTTSQVSFHSCNFNATANLSGLITNITNSKFNFEGEHIVLGPKCKNAVLADNTYQGIKKITDRMSNSGRLFDRDYYKTYQEAPDFEYVPFIKRQPTRNQLYLANNYSGITSGDGVDDAPGIQAVLTKAGNEGGGIVFLAAGEYDIKSPINIPDNVELRGVLDNPHHSRLLVNKNLEHEFGTYFLMNHNIGNETGASIILNSNSGVRGISAYYPGQTIYATGVAIKYPWLFRVAGDNAYIKNVTAVNPYQLIDNASFKTDSFYVENIFGYPLTNGIRVGSGSTNCMLRNVHYNNTSLGQTYYPNNDEKEEEWTHEHLELFKFGDTKNLEMLFCFGRQCKYGVVLDNENGTGPNGISIGFGVEDIPKGATLKVDANNGFQFVNTSLLADATTINFNTSDSLSLFNSRTKNSKYFIKSGGKGGSLFFNQVLHRGVNTIIEGKGDHIEVNNLIFHDGMQFNVRESEFPVVFYGGFLKSGDLVVNCKSNELSKNYLEQPYFLHDSLKLNLDLFIYPGNVKYDPTLNANKLRLANKGLVCYPNPAHHILNLQSDGQNMEEVVIFDMYGKLVYKSSINETTFSIPVSNFGPSGLYVVVISIGGKRISK